MMMTAYQKLFISHILAIGLVTTGMGIYIYTQLMEDLFFNLQSRLLENATLMSQNFDAHQLHAIRTPKDIDKQAYRTNIIRIRDLLTSNPDINDLYIMRRGRNEALYVLNSDAVAIANIGAKHQPYIAEMIDGFYQPAVDKQITSNQWGSFLSAYAPIKNGRGQYLIGIDMRADEIIDKRKAMQLTAIIAFIFSLVCALLCSFIVSRHFTHRISILMQRMSAKAPVVILDKKKGDPLDQLVATYESMVETLYEKTLQSDRSQKQTQEKLSHLERHFKLHTGDLEQSNEQLRSEIEQRTKVEKELAKVACTDELTGLINRRAVMRILHKLIKNYGQQPQEFCIILIDIANFKEVNQQHGMAVADQVLVQFCTFLRSRLNTHDTIGRWGGSDFILLMDKTSISDAQDFAHELYTALKHFHFHSGQVQLKTHMGISAYRAAMEADQAINHAASALMQAKQRGSYCAVHDGSI